MTNHQNTSTENKTFRESLLAHLSETHRAQAMTLAPLVADDWCERAVDALDHWAAFGANPNHETFGDLACEILAVWTGLQRLEPSLNHQIPQLIHDLDAIVKASANTLIEAASSTLMPSDWLKAAEQTKTNRQASSDIDEAQFNQLHGLFEDLDDAELIVAAFTALSPTHAPILEENLAPCVHWFCSNLDTFVPLAGSIDALCAALRDDLEDFASPELTATLYKLSPLREEIDADRFEMALIQLAIQQEQLATIVNIQSARDRKEPKIFLASYQPRTAAASAETRENNVLLNWEGPSASWTAFARINEPSQKPDTAALTIYVSNIEPSHVSSVKLGPFEAQSLTSGEGMNLKISLLFGHLRAAINTSDDTLTITFNDGHFEEGVCLENQ